MPSGARVQGPLLAIVLVLAVVSATLLSTLYLLDRSTATFAARAALDEASPDETKLSHVIAAAGPVTDIVESSARAAHQGLGEIPAAAYVHVEGALQVVPTSERYALTYYATDDRLEELAVIVDGRWPAARSVGMTEIAVPQAMIDDLDLATGDVIDLKERSYDDEAASQARIVGVYLPIDPDGTLWRGDTLGGAGFSPAVAVPGAGGGLTAPAYGPLFTTRDRVETLPVDTVTVTYQPDFSSTSLEELRGIASALNTAERDAQLQLGDLARRVVVDDPVRATAGSVVGSLTMTRSTVIVMALLLLVVATAALVQAARLVSERRHDERHLLAARGASARQTFHVGAIEALVIGAATVAAAAPLARLAFLNLSHLPLLRDAGLAKDPGIPPGAWIAGGIVAALLVVIVLAPLARRSPLLAQAEGDRARPGARASFQRAGLDIAAVVLAGLAFWQLSLYRSPVVTGEEAPRLDPLLAAGPALALLAGALLAARLVPLAARLMEAITRTGRRAVTSLAAWEVARRPVRALSAVLLLTLSLSVGVFASGFLATWEQSQRDQALYRHPVDAVVTAPDAGWMRQALVVSAPDATAAPVAHEGVAISPRSLGELTLTRAPFNGTGARLLASTSEGWAPLGTDRLAEVNGQRLAMALASAEVESAQGVSIPDGAAGIALTLTATPASAEFTDVLVGLRALVRSQTGLLHTIDLGVVNADGRPHEVSAALGDSIGGASLTGLQVIVASTGEAQLSQQLLNADRVRISFALEDLAAVTPLPSWNLDSVPAPVESLPLGADVLAGWTPTATAGYVDDVVAGDASVALSISAPLDSVRGESVVGVLSAAPLVDDVPIVVTDALLRTARMSVGDDVTMQVGATYVRAHVSAAVPRVGSYTGYVVAAPLDALQQATFQAGGVTREVAEWWVSTPQQQDYAASLPPGVDVTTREGVVDELTTNPLRVAITASIWVVVGAAALLAALGFAVHIVVSTRSRALELAQLRAVGLSSGGAVRMIGLETALLAAIGTLCGVGIGLWLVTLTAPLVSFGPDGLPPIPEVVVQVPWGMVAALALESVVVVLLSLAIAAVLVRRIHAADLLRQGDAR